MKVLVAGATGMAGSAIIKELLSRGETVIGISRSNVDLLNAGTTREFLLSAKPDVVIDAAAKVGGIAANKAYPVEFLTQNLKMQLNLMEASHLVGVRKFVFLASNCIYPRDSLQPMKEEYLMTGHLEDSNSSFAIAKIAGIELVNAYRQEFDHDWISLLPASLYGPGDNFKYAESHVFPALIRRFVEAVDTGEREVTLWGSGLARREFLFIEDFAKAVLVAIDNYDSKVPLNIGSGAEISICDLATMIAKSTGFNGVINWDTEKPEGVPRKLLDSKHINEIGWEARTSLQDGVDLTVSWFRNAGKDGLIRI
jgi:GDP-L-fucose synthase